MSCKSTNFTPGVNFINVLQAAFMPADPKRVKFQLSHQYHFTLLESAHVKAVRTMLMKLSQGCRLCLRSLTSSSYNRFEDQYGFILSVFSRSFAILSRAFHGFELRYCKSLRQLEPFGFRGFSDLRNPQSTKLAGFGKAPKPDSRNRNPILRVFRTFARFWTSKSGFVFRNRVSETSRNWPVLYGSA
jgi:hypothetical protein